MKQFITILLLLITQSFIYGQDETNLIDKITKAIKSMNAAELAETFNTTIDLEVGGTDGSYSKKQAEMILRDFFSKTPVKSFSVNHKGSSNDGSNYMIGSYESANQKKYRVYILLKKQNSQHLIHLLQFEEE